eukprot:gb/GFBE01017886.1/.p1 GENE.gb/GFBE01017886.1/~~gb/GFBE01017886.1/.p1  ORF type:complete len:146 (+),score=36.21 gb/GFBE01017886.1/:1-438(+)
MAAAYAQQKKMFLTAGDEVAHQRLIQNKWYPGGQPAAAIESEEEVRFIGADCYVPRLVAANVPIAKPAPQPQGAAPQETGGYAEPLQAKRPVFLRPQNGGVAPAAPGAGPQLPSGGGALPKGRAKTEEQPQQPAFPFNLLNSPGL